VASIQIEGHSMFAAIVRDDVPYELCNVLRPRDSNLTTVGALVMHENFTHVNGLVG
jgi:hypothetical protein